MEMVSLATQPRLLKLLEAPLLLDSAHCAHQRLAQRRHVFRRTVRALLCQFAPTGVCVPVHAACCDDLVVRWHFSVQLASKRRDPVLDGRKVLGHHRFAVGALPHDEDDRDDQVRVNRDITNAVLRMSPNRFREALLLDDNRRLHHFFAHSRQG